MGNSLNRNADQLTSSPNTEEEPDLSEKHRGQKRRHEDDSSDGPSIKVTKLDTAKYVYEKLFLQGEGSDIKIEALDQTWNLHKLYLQQCNFFEALLNGCWKDSTDEVLHLDIPDSDISVTGLHAVFGSLYHNEIKYKSSDREAILAAASLFQLESVLERCDVELAAELDHDNVVTHLNMGIKYGLEKVRLASLSLLKWNFWKLMKNKKMLQQVDEDVLMKLMSSSELLIVEGEMDLYSMLKTWIYLREEPSAVSLDDDEFASSLKEYLADKEPGELFLRHAALFSAVRLHHLVTSTGSISVVESDALVPREVLRGLMVDQWKTVIANEENPTASATITDEDFHLNSIRLGRVIDSTPKCWRWTGYNYGVDIILNYNQGLLTMKRNCLHQSTPYSINLKSERAVHFRLLVCDDSGSRLYDSGKQLLAMRLDQSVVVCRLPDDTAFPFSVHLFYLAAQPPPPSLLYVNQYVRSRISQTI